MKHNFKLWLVYYRIILVEYRRKCYDIYFIIFFFFATKRDPSSHPVETCRCRGGSQEAKQEPSLSGVAGSIVGEASGRPRLRLRFLQSYGALIKHTCTDAHAYVRGPLDQHVAAEARWATGARKAWTAWQRSPAGRNTCLFQFPLALAV
jgi:hypothetical protein